MIWKTNGIYFTMYMDIDNEIPIAAEYCSLSIEGSLEATQFRQYQAMHWENGPEAVSTWQKFQLKNSLPMFHSNDSIPETGSFLYLFPNVCSTWNEAAARCNDMGGKLFSLNSYEQWPILMNNVLQWYQHNHFFFWSSALVFVGIPEVRNIY